jgi:hemin uptake protein HemP
MTDSRIDVPTVGPCPVSALAADTARRPLASNLPRLSSQHILGSAREVVIDHQGMEYRLRHTRAGKLILTK